MTRRPPRSTRTDSLFPYTTLFRSAFFTADKLILQEAARGPCVPEHWPIALNLQEGARVPCKLIQEQSALKSARRGIKRDLLSFPALHLRSTPSLSSAPKRTRTLDTWKAGKPLRAAGAVGVASPLVLSMVVPNRKRDASRAKIGRAHV